MHDDLSRRNFYTLGGRYGRKLVCNQANPGFSSVSSAGLKKTLNDLEEEEEKV